MDTRSGNRGPVSAYGSIVCRCRQQSAPAQPLISFVVPVYNTQDTVLRSLESISALQGYCELIVVHDGGRDDSLPRVLDWARNAPLDITVLDQPNRGLSAARMSGVHHSRGSFIGFLDSDDFIDARVFRYMAEQALENGWDVAVCRSAVWDAARATTQVFYDWKIWKDVCREEVITTSIEVSPKLLRLEPNANTKIIRRDFFESAKIAFPEGLLFEDLPVHFSVLLKAERVGLVNYTGYYYRVSRLGKITEERTSRRFDMVAIGHRAIDLLLDRQVNQAAAAAGLLMVSRMVFWCGDMVPNSLKEAYFEQAFALFRRVPRPVVARALGERPCRGRDRLVLLGLATSSAGLITKLLGGTGMVQIIAAAGWRVQWGLMHLAGVSFREWLRSVAKRPKPGKQARRNVRLASAR